jgi:hypothetical protein
MLGAVAREALERASEAHGGHIRILGEPAGFT